MDLPRKCLDVYYNSIDHTDITALPKPLAPTRKQVPLQYCSAEARGTLQAKNPAAPNTQGHLHTDVGTGSVAGQLLYIAIV